MIENIFKSRLFKIEKVYVANTSNGYLNKKYLIRELIRSEWVLNTVKSTKEEAEEHIKKLIKKEKEIN